jgi:hypothetical protein
MSKSLSGGEKNRLLKRSEGDRCGTRAVDERYEGREGIKGLAV